LEGIIPNVIFPSLFGGCLKKGMPLEWVEWVFAKTFSFFLMPLPLNFFKFSSDNYWVAQKKIQNKKIQIRYLHLVKPSAIGFTGIGPMLSFALLNYSKSVASGFTLHKTRGVSHGGLAIYI
jgi:hypothetical protein